MLKKMISFMCIMPLIVPTTYIAHENFNSTIANACEVDNINIDDMSNKIDKGILPYKIAYETKMLNEVSKSLEVQQIQQKESIKQIPHYNANNLSEKSNLSEEQIYQMLNGSPLQTLYRAYYWYEQQYNVNVIFVIALNTEESGNGKSNLARDYNNLGGYKNGDGSYHYFNNWGDSVKETFRLISEEYINPNGQHHVSEPSIYSINMKYCPEPVNDIYKWSREINQIAKEYMKKI